MIKFVSRFYNDENAQAMVEYVLILSILTLASYGVVKLFLAALASKFNKIKFLRSGPAGVMP
ncbi:MAG: hypothetical protein LHV68_03840 [Elusimicrobia bacterium]|nr:hypothetical protein [Candidatus Liberimonas magnetica]